MSHETLHAFLHRVVADFRVHPFEHPLFVGERVQQFHQRGPLIHKGREALVQDLHKIETPFSCIIRLKRFYFRLVFNEQPREALNEQILKFGQMKHQFMKGPFTLGRPLLQLLFRESPRETPQLIHMLCETCDDKTTMLQGHQ